jgi:hypothetical protein
MAVSVPQRTLTKPNRPCCDSCRFAEPVLNNQDVQYVRPDGISLWECHRHAPVVVLTRGGGAQREWPNVLSVYWCGDHEPVATSEPVSQEDQVKP